MEINPSVQTTSTGLVGSITIRVLALPDPLELLPPTTIGIIEAPNGSGTYIWNGSIPDGTTDYLVVWDYPTTSGLRWGIETFGRRPVLKYESGLTPSVQFVNPDDGTVIIPETTSGIIETPQFSGIYIYQGTIPDSQFLVVWKDGGHYASEEFPAGSEVSPPPGTFLKPIIKVSYKEVGNPPTPQEIKRFRRQVMDMCRLHGQTVVAMHQFNNQDVEDGVAKLCPACFLPQYGQVRNKCPVCFGVGFVSVENDLYNYIDDNGQIVTGDPGTGIRAPALGGYSQRYLTWIIEPDIAVNVFKINEQGVMVQTQNAQGYAPWFPQLGDNDLIVNVDVESNQYNIIRTNERFQLKMTQPVTLRGWGSRNHRGQQYKVGQQFQMSEAIKGTVVFDVPV